MKLLALLIASLTSVVTAKEIFTVSETGDIVDASGRVRYGDGHYPIHCLPSCDIDLRNTKLIQCYNNTCNANMTTLSRLYMYIT